MAGHRKGGKPKNKKEEGRKDLESGPTYKPQRKRFRDVANAVVENGTTADKERVKLKEILQQPIEGMDDLKKYRKSDEELKKIKNKKVRAFYEEQNGRLDDWMEVDAIVRTVSDDVLETMDPGDHDGDGLAERHGGLHDAGENVLSLLPEDTQERRRTDEKHAKWAINVNVIANVFLLAAKITACFFSGSLSLIASTTDSALDLLCTLIVYTTNRLVSWRLSSLSSKFPVGRRRLEPIGIMVFAVIMVISFLQILQESVKKILPEAPRKAEELPATAIGALAATVIVKGIIWIGCARVKTTQVQALAQDCKTDVIFNTLSLAFPLIGYHANIWWLDPVGAGLLSLYIIFDWSSTCFENVVRLTGIGVDDATLKKIIYLTWRFSPVVKGYKSVKAYHAGDGVWCEVDLLLDEKTSLEHAHDVSETLQYCMEALDDVDRAFISVDYNAAGPTGHAPAP